MLTEQIPIVAPVRTRVVEFGRSGSGDSRGPDRPMHARLPGDRDVFPWTVRVNGEAAHSFNANRISLLIPKPGEVEHWTYINGGGGWDHPIHLHFEEGITMNRGGAPIPATEKLVSKDVWRLRPSGRVTVPGPVRRVRRVLRQPLPQHGARRLRHADAHPAAARRPEPQVAVTPTPNPTPDGVLFTTPEILPEGDPRSHEQRSAERQRQVGNGIPKGARAPCGRFLG